MKNGQTFLGWLQWDAKYLPGNIIQGIKNIFKWLPIVWKDRDFDYSYIIRALRFKIENTANYIEKHNRYEGNELDVQKMRLCLKLIDKINSDFYECEYQEYYKTNMFTEKLENGLHEYKSEVIEDNLDLYFKKYPNDYRRLSEKHKDKRIHSALFMGKMRTERATYLLFTIISRNIYKWWD